MDIVISNSSADPIYQQIYEQLSSQIINGKLKSEECLPPIRTVARELRISVITVKRAWEELERAGFIYTVTGKGCFIAPLASHELASKRNNMAKDKLINDFARYRSLGLTKDELIKIIQKYY